MKRSLLVAAISATIAHTASAAPLAPLDARGMAMGNTGVSAARMSSAPYYNPALLSASKDSDDFSLVLPSIGFTAAGADDFIDASENMTENEYNNEFFTSNGDTLIDHFDTISGNIDSLLSDGSNSIQNKVDALDAAIASGNATAITTAASDLNSSVTTLNAQTNDLEATTKDLTGELNSVNDAAIRAMVGINPIAVALPSKTLGVAFSTSVTGNLSAQLTFSKQDQGLLNSLATAVNGYTTVASDYSTSTIDLADCLNTAPLTCATKAQTVVDAQNALKNYEAKDDNGNSLLSTAANGDIQFNGEPQLTSQIQVVGIAIVDAGVSLSREFNIKGHDIAFGITPKIQKVTTIDYIGDADSEIDDDTLEDSKKDETAFNIDLGAAYQFGNDKEFQAGVVIKNLLSKTFKTTNGIKVNQDSQIRAAVSHHTSWSTVAVDLDLLENKPIAFESPTQYLGIGGELDAFGFAQLRAGYRMNLADTDENLASAGVGFWLFGPRLDIAVNTNLSDPAKESGFIFQLGMDF